MNSTYGNDSEISSVSPAVIKLTTLITRKIGFRPRRVRDGDSTWLEKNSRVRGT